MLKMNFYSGDRTFNDLIEIMIMSAAQARRLRLWDATDADGVDAEGEQLSYSLAESMKPRGVAAMDALRLPEVDVALVASPKEEETHRQSIHSLGLTIIHPEKEFGALSFLKLK